jgi:hypothetical protein
VKRFIRPPYWRTEDGRRVYRKLGFRLSEDADLQRRLTVNDPVGRKRILLELAGRIG